MVLATGPALAQHLDLDGEGAQPPLGLDTFAGRCIGQLQVEIEALGASSAAGTTDAEVLRACINVRGLTGRLLDHGDRMPSEAAPAFLLGYTLFRGRQAIDEALRQIPGIEAQGTRTAALEALRRFNDLAPRFGVPAAEADLDGRVAALAAPLAEAVLAPGGDRPVTHWVSRADADGAGALEALTARLDAPALDPDTVEALAAIADLLRRGAAFEEYRGRVVSYSELLLSALDLAAAVEAAPWLQEDGRAAYRRAIHEAVIAFGSRETREQGRETLERLAATSRLVTGLTALATAPTAGMPGEARDEAASERARRVARLRSVLLSAVQSAQDRAIQTKVLASAAEAMAASAARPASPLPADLRRAWRQIEESHRRTEEAIVDRAADLLSPGALSDPDLASLAAAHAESFEDLQRFDRLPAWSETARRLAPEAAGPFSGRARRLLLRLAEPARRAEAAAELGNVEREMSAFAPLPFEVELRTGTVAAVVATGGRHEELARAIDAARGGWVAAWGEGADDAGGRMWALHRLLSAMAGAAPLLGGADGGLLNEWSAWEVDPQTLARGLSSLTGRLKLASAAAIDGDAPALGRQLDRIEAAPLALAGRLTSELDDALGALPRGAASTFGQLLFAPAPGCFMAGRRGELAELCRYMMELETARETGREELALKIGLLVVQLARELIDVAFP